MPKKKELKEEKIQATLTREHVIAEDCKATKILYDQSRFGEPKEGNYQYALVEGLYLLEKGKMEITDDKGKKLTADKLIKHARKVESTFWIRYVCFRDMRQRGYIVKTALKFGADFRVYDRGVKPGEDHAKWIVYPVHEGEALTWYEFSAKNRVAHSTRKKLLLAIVDGENDCTYYEVSWKRP